MDGRGRNCTTGIAGVRVHARFWAREGVYAGVVRVLGAMAGLKGGRAWLWHAAGSPPWRRSGGGTPEMVFLPLQWTTSPRI